MKLFNGVSIALPLITIITTNAGAANSSEINISGLLTNSITQSDNNTDTSYNNGLASHELDFSNRENILGLQLQAQIDAKVKLTSQLVARGGNSNYDMEVDWAYLNIQTSEHSNMHLGKYKIPLFIVSDYMDVGFAYPWVRPPQEVYIINPLISQSGIDWFYNIQLKQHNVLIQIYYGSGTHDVFIPARSIDLNSLPLKKDQSLHLKTKESGGINITLQSNIFSFRVGYFETIVNVNEGPIVINGAKGNFTGMGLTLDADNFILYSEYVSRDTDTNVVLAFPDQKAWYITLGYKFASLLPYMTYANIGKGNDDSNLSIEQTSTSLGIRYDYSKNSAFKFEALQAAPAQNNHGLFHEPVDKGMIYTGTFDVIF